MFARLLQMRKWRCPQLRIWELAIKRSLHSAIVISACLVHLTVFSPLLFGVMYFFSWTVTQTSLGIWWSLRYTCMPFTVVRVFTCQVSEWCVLSLSLSLSLRFLFVFCLKGDLKWRRKSARKHRNCASISTHRLHFVVWSVVVQKQYSFASD